MHGRHDGDGPQGRRWAFPARLRRRTVAAEVDAELAFHLDMRMQEFLEQGLTPEAARAEALRRIGNYDQVRDSCRTLGEARERDMQRTEWLDEVRQDLRFGARQLLRSRGLTIAAVLTLALGVGATAAIFSVVDAVVLRPLPFHAPERVVALGWESATGRGAVSGANFLDWREQTASFERMAAFVETGFTLTGGELPELLSGARVSADYFAVFGVQPLLGRTFLPEEDEPGRGRVAVLSARTWARHFGSAPDVLGRSVQLNGAEHTIVGVMPPSFDYLERSPQLWVPLALDAAARADRGASYLSVAGRLAPGVSVERAQRAMGDVAHRLAQEYPDDVDSSATIRVEPFASQLTGDHRGRLLTLLAAVGFVLLIGCANVANLLLARGAARHRELAIRAALGAGRHRIVRQLFTESLLLALLGGAAGALLAVGGVRALVAIAPSGVPRLEQAQVDARVLLFTLALSILCSILFGLVPALRAARPQLEGTLREGGRTVTSGSRDRLRGGLVVLEVALTLVLLTGAGLLTRSALLLGGVEPGFDPDRVLTTQLMLPAARYEEPAQVVRAFDDIVRETRAVPGVSSAALVLFVPLGAGAANAGLTAEGRPWTDENRLPARFQIASEGYLETLRIPLASGRTFTERDRAAAPRVALVNETLARQLWPGETAVGRRVSGITGSPEDPQWTEVVGVVRDVRGAGLAAEVPAEIYYPVGQTPPVLWPLLQRALVLVARAGNEVSGATALERPLRAAVARVDANLPIGEPRTLDSYLSAALATARFTGLLLGTLSAIGLVLAAIGIYGIVAYFVTQRLPEIGVRVALGATPRHVARIVLHSGLRPVVLGIVVGIAASLAATRLLRGLLYGVTPSDPVTVACVVALLLGAAVAATLGPVRRAMRVDPATVMRR